MTFDLGREGHMNIFRVGMRGHSGRGTARAKGQGQSFADSHVMVGGSMHVHVGTSVCIGNRE